MIKDELVHILRSNLDMEGYFSRVILLTVLKFHLCTLNGVLISNCFSNEMKPLSEIIGGILKAVHEVVRTVLNLHCQTSAVGRDRLMISVIAEFCLAFVVCGLYQMMSPDLRHKFWGVIFCYGETCALKAKRRKS